MVLLRAHGTAVRQRHVACQEAGHGVFLPERCQRVQLLHVFQRELVEVDARVDLDERVEGVFGQGVHVGAQTLGERRQVLCGQGDAHGGVMAAEPRGQVGHGLDGLEEVDLPHASPRPARLVALDGEQQGRHAVRVHQAACHDALHAFVPAFARHHQCALPVVDLGGLGLGDLGPVSYTHLTCAGYILDRLSGRSWKFPFLNNSAGRWHFLLSPLDCLPAKAGGAVNGCAYAPFILTVDWLGWVCYLPDKLEFILSYHVLPS